MKMMLMHWEPLREINSLQREINRSLTALSPFQTNDFMIDCFMPAAEITETDAAIVLQVELPGLNLEAVDVQVSADAVSIQGERKSATTTEENGITRSEFHYGSCRRVISLNVRVDNTNMTMAFCDSTCSKRLKSSIRWSKSSLNSDGYLKEIVIAK